MRIFNATITDRDGTIQPGASITVRDEATSSLITLYDIDDNVIGNPFLIGADGLCQFKILDDRYIYVLAEFGSESQEWRFVPMYDYEVRFDANETDISALEGRATLSEQRNPAGRIVPSMFTEDPAVLGVRQINLLGQVVEIADYPEACNNLYVGDANNATAPAFYKTSDSGGTIRNTAGSYMVFPDTSGLGLKGIGNAVISGRTKTGPAELGEVQEDQMQLLTGEYNRKNATLGPLGPSDWDLEGVFVAGPATGSRDSGSSSNGFALHFNSANSPNARASADTDGETRDSTMGSYWSVIY